ncbi:hypothetical protein A2U01_0084092, partial [Trifolium medium]|nr:hypothetical protein [Trifolium medium]
INRMRQIARDLLNSGELPEGSRVRRDVQDIWAAGNYARQYKRRGGITESGKQGKNEC